MLFGKLRAYLDAEIAALEQRRDKTRALKQGMMQELLTGASSTRLCTNSFTWLSGATTIGSRY